MKDHAPENDELAADSDEVFESVCEAISECLDDLDLQIEPKERVILAKELIENFTSPLMIQKAAGATSQVSVTISPGGGVQDGRSLKLRNVRVNLKQAALALPASLPALANFLLKHGVSDTVGTASLAILYFFPLLKSISDVLQVPITQQAAAILMVMWNCKNETEESVPHEGLLENVNATFKEYRWQEITSEELISYFGTLEKIGCIKRDRWPDSIDSRKWQWRLTEAVKI